MSSIFRGAPIGPSPSFTEHFGYTEPFRRFVQRETFAPQANEIPNTAPSWLPGDDYYTNFHVGDPYTKVDQGFARLPGAGYAAVHPEIAGLDPEDYPDINKLAILADVAPYSREYHTYRQRVASQAQDDTGLEIEFEKIMDRVKKRNRPGVFILPDTTTLTRPRRRATATPIPWMPPVPECRSRLSAEAAAGLPVQDGQSPPGAAGMSGKDLDGSSDYRVTGSDVFQLFLPAREEIEIGGMLVFSGAGRSRRGLCGRSVLPLRTANFTLVMSVAKSCSFDLASKSRFLQGGVGKHRDPYPTLDRSAQRHEFRARSRPL